MEKIAIIDLGTNTFHLMIAERTGKILSAEKVAVKIGSNGISRGLISEDAYLRALNALKYFKKKIVSLDISECVATATSAIRNASNGRKLVKDIRKATGINVQVISGKQEAELIYYGVRQAVELGGKPALILDIGGGSCEFIIGDSREIFWKESYEIGAQRLLDLFHRDDPMPEEEMKNLFSYLDQHLITLTKAVEKYKPSVLVGSSGTFDTLWEIDVRKQGREPKDENGYEISFEGFEATFDEIVHKSRKDRMDIPGMIEMRVDMIVVATGLIDFVMRKYKLPKIKVSAYALKEGILYRVMKGLSVAPVEE